MKGTACGKIYQAHRVAWTLTNGPIPEGMVVMHTCDNPPCINPAHLRIGTQLDNIADRGNKRRTQHGERHWMAKMNDHAVMEVRRRWASGESADALAIEYSIARTAMQRIVYGQAWKHLPILRRPDAQSRGT